MTFDLNWKRLCFYALCVLFAGLTFSTALAEVMLFIALGFWLIWKFRQGKASFAEGWDAGFVLLAAFTVFCAMTVVWSDFPKQSAKGILKVFEHFFLMWMVRDVFLEARSGFIGGAPSQRNVRDEESKARAADDIGVYRRYSATQESEVYGVSTLSNPYEAASQEKKDFDVLLVFVFAAIVLDAAVQCIFGRDLIRGFSSIPASAGFRLTASFKNYGLFATFLLLTLPYAAALSLEQWRQAQKSWKAPAFSILTAAGLLFLFLTRSRGAILAIAGSGLLLFFMRREWKRIFLVLAFFLLIIPFLPKRMILHLDIQLREQSLVERFYLWDRAVQVIEARPFGGTGINTYAAAHEHYDHRHNWRVRGYYAHNGYLQTAAETGLTGLALFLTGLWLLFSRALKSLSGGGLQEPERLRLWAILTGLWGFLLICMVDTELHNNQAVIFLWFFLGLCEAYSNKKFEVGS